MPDSSDVASGQVAFAAHGRAHGLNEPGSRDFAWDQSGKSNRSGKRQVGVRRATLNRQLQYDTDWVVQRVTPASFFAEVLVFGAVFGSAGTALAALGEAADQLELEQIVLPVHRRRYRLGGAAFVLGPEP